VTRRLVGLVAAVCLVVGACSPSTATPRPTGLTVPTIGPAASDGTVSSSPAVTHAQLTGTSYKAVAPTKTGGTVTLAEWRYPSTVNPYFALNAWEAEINASMFDGLVRVSPDLKYVPDLANSVPTLENGGVVPNGPGMDVTWQLRLGMKWSDGQPINCDDLKATWLWIMDPGTTRLTNGTVGWRDVSGIDGGTGNVCVMHFSHIYEGYLTLVSAVLPAHYLSTAAPKDAAAKLYPMTNPAAGVYSGPYIPASAKPATSITLKPNPNWSTISGHLPYLDGINWKFYGAADTLIAGFKTGDFDLGQGLTNLDIPAVSSLDQNQVSIKSSLTYELQAFNNASFKTKFGADARTIIRAVMTATDRKQIANGPLAGNVTVDGNFVSPLAWFYKSEADTTTPDSVTASTVLANAGFARNKDGFLEKNGKTLELNYCTTTRQLRVDVLKLVQSQLHDIGIKVNIYPKPPTDVFSAAGALKPLTPCSLYQGNYDVAEFSLVSPIDPLSGYSTYHSSETPEVDSRAGQNVTRVNLAPLDAAYDGVRSSVDFDSVRDAMYKVQDLYSSDQNSYELPLYFLKDVWLVAPRLHNFTGNPTAAGAEWNIGDWWVG